MKVDTGMPAELKANELETALKDAGYQVLGVIAVKEYPQDPTDGSRAVDVTFIVAEEKQDLMLLPNFPIQIAAAVAQVSEWLRARIMEQAACSTKQ